MVTIIGLFALLAGILATVANSRNNSFSVQSISYFILGLSALLLSKDYFESSSDNHHFIPYLLISILSIHFFVGEITKNKTALFWNVIPIIGAVTLFLIPNLSDHAYMDFSIENNLEVFLIAILSAVTPFLTHLAKLGIGNLVIRFGSIKWAENEENYLESLVSYAFIGGVAALGSFLLGSLGLIVAATFYLSASFIARNKLGLKNDIILAASGALFLLVIVPIILEKGGFSQLNFSRGEVLEGAFVAGFMIIIHDLLLRLARYNTGKWKILLAFKAMFVPVLAIVVLGFAYLAFERLGGVLSLTGMLISMALLSVTFALFKDSSYVSLKLLSVGAVLLILPYIKPVEQTSSIDLSALGISSEAENQEEGGAEPKGKPLDEVIGDWVINEEKSKVFFELGPKDGRTKGEFKTVKGEFKINETVSNSDLKVILPVSELTTFISPRDKELMGPDYFNEEEFPEITFESSTIKEEDDAYIVTGDFTMMGITKSLEVKLKLIGKGEKEGKPVIVLWGKSEVDRTDFGMSPSSKIGNVVDFNYEVQLEER